MYGGIEKLKSQPFVLDKEKMRELGLKGDTLAMAGATMRYQAGCIRRERERLARIFAVEKDPEKIAEAILDNSLDEKVFKWHGPETPLDVEPVSRGDRDKQKESEQEKT